MKRWPLFNKKIGWDNILLGLFFVLLIVPQTRKPIQVGLNRLIITVFSPSMVKETKRVTIEGFDYRAYDREGNEVVLRIGDGHIVFLSFWASWCPPCIAELPSIAELYADYGEKVKFILATHEDPEKVKAFLDKKNMDLPVYFPLGQVPGPLQSTSLPTNYLIDANGSILIEEKGAADWNHKKIRDLLDSLVLKSRN